MKKDTVFYTSLIMAFTAGFVDTSTFTSANGLFSAHITGNLVVFAYKVSNHATLGDFINLLSFPIFILAIIFSAKFNSRFKNEKKITSLIGLFLITAGIIAFFLKQQNISTGIIYHSMLMLIIFAMGIQNTVGRLYVSSIFGPTTVMTGNITRAIVDLFSYNSVQHTSKELLDLKQSLILLSGFVVGCISGAFISSNFGLVSMLIPGMILVLYYILFFKKE
jgi:uncharacterized membrane protein YoaK (UPF0700 family)